MSLVRAQGAWLSADPQEPSGIIGDVSDAHDEPTPIAAQSVEQLLRQWFRGRDRTFRIAAVVVVIVGIVAVAAVAFWTGFAGGARSGHHHHASGAHHSQTTHTTAPPQ